MWFKLLIKTLSTLRIAKKIGRTNARISTRACNQKARLVAATLINYIKDAVLEDQLALARPGPFKIKVMGKSEHSMYDTGALMNHVHLKKVSDCVYMVYWDNRRVYEYSSKTAKQIIDHFREPRKTKLTGEAKKRWAKWFWTQVTKAGYEPEDVKSPRGRAGVITHRAMPFYDRAVRRFKQKMQGKEGIQIFSHQGDDKTILIKAL